MHIASCSRLLFHLLAAWLIAMALPAFAASSDDATSNDSGSGDKSGQSGGTDQQASAVPQILKLQGTTIAQQLLPMKSLYQSEKSLLGNGDGAISQSYTLSIGSQLSPRWQAYADIRLQRGDGIAEGNGLAGYVNNDFYQVASREPPYFNRAFFRYVKPLGTEMEKVEKDADKLPGKEPVDRLEIKIGRILLPDDFDSNRYDNNPTIQFENFGLVNNSAWDNASNARGVTNGLVVGVIHPCWALRWGSYQMPTTANGPDLDNNVFRTRSDQLELTWQPREKGATYRFMVYRNQANMEDYAEAIAITRATGTTPDITADERSGRTKRGVSFNLEKPLADDGNTGLFAYAGWNDGRTEDYSFTESDRDICFGGQISGMHWHRKDDRLGIGMVINGLSTPHRDYLALGGKDFQIGDGRLNYGTERIVEAYYAYQAIPWLQFGPDVQLIQNAAYNRDRGPATVIGARFHVEF